jgi:hypothetical protein
LRIDNLPQTWPTESLAHRIFAAETSSLHKWKKRCSKQSWYGDTPLHLAVLNGRVDIAKYLLQVDT